MVKPLLEVEHLRVEFPTRRGRLLALDDISFQIAPGEILGVVGESGAGKTEATKLVQGVVVLLSITLAAAPVFQRARNPAGGS